MNSPQVAIIVALFFGGLCLPTVAAAMQSNTALHLGGNVRYKLAVPRSDWQQGKLTGLHSDTLRLVDKGGSGHTVAIRAIRELQVTSGQRSNTGRGAMIGGVIGAVLGLGLGVAASDAACTGICPEIGAQEVIGAAAILGGIGAGIGALIGSTSKRESWVEVSSPWSIAPSRTSAAPVLPERTE
jgi:hypothetical protein